MSDETNEENKTSLNNMQNEQGLPSTKESLSEEQSSSFNLEEILPSLVEPLSDNINVLEFELKESKRLMGIQIFRIGRRLNKIKTEKLQHGAWMDWLEEVGIGQSFANKTMQIAKKFSDPELLKNLNSARALNLGSKSFRTLTELVSVPNTALEEVFSVSNGQEKSPLDMNSNELRELKRELREKDVRLHEANGTIENLSVKNEKQEDTIASLTSEKMDLLSQKQKAKPVVQIKERIVTKEVPPKDYGSLKDKLNAKAEESQMWQVRYEGFTRDAEAEAEQSKKRIEDLEAIIANKSQPEEDAKKMVEQIKELERQLEKDTSDVDAVRKMEKIRDKASKFILDISPYLYSKSVERLEPDTYAAQVYSDLAYQIQDIANELVSRIPNGKDSRPIQMVNADVIEGQVEE